MKKNGIPLKVQIFSHSFVFFEALLVHEYLLNKLTKTQVAEALTELLKKNEFEALHPEVFWIRYNAYAIAKLLDSRGKNNGISQSMRQSQEIQYLLATGNIRSYSALYFIIQKAKEFLVMEYGIDFSGLKSSSPSSTKIFLNKISGDYHGNYPFYTPEGMLVPNVSYFQANVLPYPVEEQWLAQRIIDRGLKAKKIGPSTWRYNCGGYAFSVSEGRDTVDIGSYPTHFWADQAYSNDGQPSYIDASENEATHAVYQFDNYHALRKIQNSYPVPIDITTFPGYTLDYVSKWGYFGIYQHAKDNDIYYTSSMPNTVYKKLKTNHYGTLTSCSKIWIGAGGITHTISSTVIVPSKSSLTIKSGAIVQFTPSTSLIVNGILNIESNVILNILSGCSLIFNGALISSSNITIPSGATLVANGNSQLTFNNGSSLTINGSLYVGDDVTPTFVTFDFISPNSTTQNGIKFNSGSSGFMFYARIKNAYTGVYCNGYLPTIQNCIITNNRTGIYLYNVGTTSNAIMFNTIQNNTYEGIYMYNSNPRNLNNNTISGNGQSGIYCSYSTPHLRNNTITNNGASGVCCVLYSPALFSNYWRDPGCNKITQNYWGVSCGLESHVRIGSSTYGGYNSIYSNTSHEVRADYDSHVMAEYNWWNVPTPPYYNPSDFSTSFGGTIDYDPALSSNPLTKIASPGGGEAITKNAPFFDTELKEALDKMLDGKYEDAISIYTKRLNKEKDKSMKKYILTCITECYRESGKEGFIQYLNEKVRKNILKSDELYAITVELENLLYMQNGNYNKALENLNTLKSGFTDNGEIYKRALYGLTHLAHSYNKDDATAKSYLSELKEKYPNDLLTRDAMFLLGDIDSLITMPFKEEDILISEASINDKGVFECYPNPFNPSTVISYKITTPSNVTLKVFDILGREVAVLVNSIKDAGHYNTTFVASKMSSGVYFARLTITPLDGVKPIIQVKKMLLTK